jgi:hypothetical protein
MNYGTNASPLFGDYTLLYAGPDPLFITNACPTVCDLDADGLKDLILGNTNGYIYFFKNRNTNTSPRFNAAYDTLRTVDSTFIDATTLSRVHCADWTEDGDFDLIFGGELGNVQLCENTRIVGLTENEIFDSFNGIFNIFPNPVRHTVCFRFIVTQQCRVSIMVYSIDGRIVQRILHMIAKPGQYSRTWDFSSTSGLQIPAGVYVVEYTADEHTAVYKLVYIH